MSDESGKRSSRKQLLCKVEVSTSLQGLSASRRTALNCQIEAVDLANRLQSLQLHGCLNQAAERVLSEKIANCLDHAAYHLDQERHAFWDAQVCRENANALRSNNWESLKTLYLQNFEQIRQPVIVAPVPAMHNHPVLWSGFVALVRENSMASGLAINDPNQLARLNTTLYPGCPIGMVRTRFVGAHTVKATNIHHPPYFIPEYLPDPPEICIESVGYLLNTYTAQSVNHTLSALEPFWLPEQLAEIRQLFEFSDANEVQAALISLHNMTHFLGSQPMNHKNKESASFMRGVDEELRADSGSNVGLNALGCNLFNHQLIQAVTLMDILDRAFKYTLAAPSQSLDRLIISHHDAAAGQMRLNALRRHGALKQTQSRDQVFYYLDYQACLESDRIILSELEALDQLGLQASDSYQTKRLEFLTKYLGTNKEEDWKLDAFYDEVRAANPWLSAQLVFEYPVELELFTDLAHVA
ncbi:hypothetical protein [Coleofasciculus sp. H7-2]|uniref:hypothetical protein n=1 Tax=Coleofasciculus sp. H7-2 TaxID=3351545 RepID=UPI00366CAFC8